MALQKQPVNIDFSGGLDQKSDPLQIPLGKFARLVNSVFTKLKRWGKRNGYGIITDIDSASSITNYNNSLVSIGTTLSSYSADTDKVTDCGFIQPLSVEVSALVRSATSQTTCDVAIASNGLSCSTWLDSNASSYYQINDYSSGETVVPMTALPSTATMSRVFTLGNYFVVTYLATVSAAPHLQYIAIPIQNPSVPLAAVDISTDVTNLSTPYDGMVFSNNLYLSWNGNDGGGAIRTKYIDSALTQHAVNIEAGSSATLISVTIDAGGSVTPVVWVSFYNSGTNLIKGMAFTTTLIQVLAPTTIVSSITINELTSSATAHVLTVFYEVANTYSFSPNAKTDYIAKNTLTYAGVAGTASTILRGVGLGSKALYVASQAKSFILACYGQNSLGTYPSYQPTYFLIDSSGNVLAKIAYSNGGGYASNQVLPGLYLSGSTLVVSYLFKDLLAAVNKTQGVANINGVYSQTGINIARFTLNAIVDTVEIAGSLHIGGGFLWMFDGVKAVEHGFHVWPEDIAVSTATTGGNLADQTYFYAVTYEWTDNKGNIHRSAPSVPVTKITAGGGTSTNTVNIPTLRLTYKTTNKVRIVVYRWSTAQQNYYRVSSITSPTLNNPAVDSVTFTDTFADSAILGNDLLYTTGGVLENIAAPAVKTLALYKSRLMLIDAEDNNLIWASKQVIENTPVEMSDFLTEYIAPTTGAQGSTGPSECLSAMDDKLIIFKDSAIYYITGTGPDNTGANNDFSEPFFITSSVGSHNPRSIVLMPSGLMFQSDKGIWLLGRDLSTQYIGAGVEDYNSKTVTSALSIPDVNQIRFTLNENTCLMYDYFVGQWGTFENVYASSGTIYQGLHTYLDRFGQVFQETPNMYMDGSQPVLMSLTTSWLNLMNLQGYERAYFLDILGTYISPHKLSVQVAYDYNPSPSQQSVITPLNYSANWGGNSNWGAGSPYGGPGSLEQWKIHLSTQTCMAFQITLSEVFDPFFGTISGAGLTLSGMTCTVGAKKGYRPIPAVKSIGGSR